MEQIILVSLTQLSVALAALQDNINVIRCDLNRPRAIPPCRSVSAPQPPEEDNAHIHVVRAQANIEALNLFLRKSKLQTSGASLLFSTSIKEPWKKPPIASGLNIPSCLIRIAQEKCCSSNDLNNLAGGKKSPHQ